MSTLLLDRLRQEHSAIGEFLILLDQEAEAMIYGRFSELPGLAGRKSDAVDKVAYMRSQREAIQVTLGYAADRSGIDAATSAGGTALQYVWRVLQERAAQAHEFNHRNGVMIHTHLDFTRNAISFLQASGKPLYGPDGAHRNAAGKGNSLAVG